MTFADSAADVASLDGAILELPPHSMTVMRISETYLDWHENEFLFSHRQWVAIGNARHPYRATRL
jgi:hypothetical protein